MTLGNTTLEATNIEVDSGQPAPYPALNSPALRGVSGTAECVYQVNSRLTTSQLPAPQCLGYSLSATCIPTRTKGSPEFGPLKATMACHWRSWMGALALQGGRVRRAKVRLKPVHRPKLARFLRKAGQGPLRPSRCSLHGPGSVQMYFPHRR